MTSEIRPGYVKPIVRTLQNTAESATYYCRAVIKRSDTNTVLTTVDLVDNGSFRFTYNWTVPSFSNETYIDIAVTAYTDSGYTQISEYYGTWVEQCVIRNQVNFGGGGGSGIGYSDIEKIVERIVKKEIASIKFPEQKEVDLSDVLLLLTNLNRKNIDFEPIIKIIKDSQKSIEDKLKFPETDIKPVIDALGDNLEAIRSLESSINNDKTAIEGVLNRQIEATDKQEEITNKMKKYFADDMEEVKEKLEETNKRIGQIGVIVTKPLINDEDET